MVSDKVLTRADVRVTVQMRRVAVGRSAGAYAQERMVYSDNEQEGVGGDYRQAATCRWTGGSTGGGR